MPRKSQVPQGRLTSVPQIPFVVYHPVLLQQHYEFLLKRHFAMMLWLPTDILRYLVQLRNTNAERAVFFLSSKQTMLRKCVMHPFRRAAFDKLQRLRYRHRRGQGQQNVNMIFDTADLDRLHLVLARDATEERPKPFAQVRSDQGAAFFCAEDAMIIGTDVGHAIYSAVPAGLVQCGI